MLQDLSLYYQNGQIVSSGPQLAASALPAATSSSPGIAVSSGPPGTSLAGLGLGLASIAVPDVAGNLGTVAQRLYAYLCTAYATVTVTKIGGWLQQAGATPGAGVNGFALYTEAGALLAATGDMTTAFESAVSTTYVPVEGTLTSSQVLTAGANYYLAMLNNFTGTTPSFAASVSPGVAYPAVNGHYPMGYLASQASFPTTVTLSAMQGSAASRLAFLYAR